MTSATTEGPSTGGPDRRQTRASATERLLFVGGPAHGEVLEVDQGARHWLVLDGRHPLTYTRETAYENGPALPDFFHVMTRSNGWNLAGALEIARAAGWEGPTYIDRAIDAMRERRGHWAPRPGDQCDGTCTVDCGHCKGQGPPDCTDPRCEAENHAWCGT